MRRLSGVLAAVLLSVPALTFAQAASPAAGRRSVFVDVNLLGMANSLAESREFATVFVLFGEGASSRAIYPRPSRANLWPRGLGGGLMLWRSFGAGLSYDRRTFANDVDVTTTIPHPVFLNASASAAAVSGALAREESSMNIFVALVPLRTRRVELRFAGGPSLFSYTADMVKEVSFTQVFDPLTTQNTITISGVTSESVSSSAVGFHLGADVAYFVTDMFGVTGGVKYDRGTVTLDRDPLSKIKQDVRVGSTLMFVGVRVHLGR